MPSLDCIKDGVLDHEYDDGSTSEQLLWITIGGLSASPFFDPNNGPPAIRLHGSGSTWEGDKTITMPNGLVRSYHAYVNVKKELVTIDPIQCFDGSTPLPVDPDVPSCDSVVHRIQLLLFILHYSDSEGRSKTGVWRGVKEYYDPDNAELYRWVIEYEQDAPTCTQPQLIGPDWLGPNDQWIIGPYSLQLVYTPDDSDESSITLQQAYDMMPPLTFSMFWTPPTQMKVQGIFGPSSTFTQESNGVSLYPNEAGVLMPDGTYRYVSIPPASRLYYDMQQDSLSVIGQGTDCTSLSSASFRGISDVLACRYSGVWYTSKNLDRRDITFQATGAGVIWRFSFSAIVNLIYKCAQNACGRIHGQPQDQNPAKKDCIGGAAFLIMECAESFPIQANTPCNQPTLVRLGVESTTNDLSFGFPQFPNPGIEPQFPFGYPVGGILWGYDNCVGEYSISPFQLVSVPFQAPGIAATVLGDISKTWFRNAQITFAGKSIL